MSYSRALLFGRWYRNDLDSEGHQLVEYADFAAEGSFEFTFITLSEKDEVIEQIIELGDWGLVGDIHFTMTKNEVVDGQLYDADLNDSGNYHAYRVLHLNHHTFKYQHIETNEIFEMRKVIDKIGHC